MTYTASRTVSRIRQSRSQELAPPWERTGRVLEVTRRFQKRADPISSASPKPSLLGNIDGLALELTPDYNVAPQTMQPVIMWDEQFGTRTLHMMFWRFLPRYVTDPKQFKLSTINAKGETLLSNKMWQDSFLKRRCLIPADSFIEWRKDGKTRLPWTFAMKDDQPFALGGVWRHWRSPDRKQRWTPLRSSPWNPMNLSQRRPATTECRSSSRGEIGNDGWNLEALNVHLLTYCVHSTRTR